MPVESSDSTGISICSVSFKKFLDRSFRLVTPSIRKNTRNHCDARQNGSVNVQALIDDLNRLAALQSEINRLTAQIPHATPAQKSAIGQRLSEMQEEIKGKQMEGDRTT